MYNVVNSQETAIQAKNESSTKSCIYLNHIYLPLFHYTDIAIIIMKNNNKYEIIGKNNKNNEIIIMKSKVNQ